jgi:hypothetical protein
MAGFLPYSFIGTVRLYKVGAERGRGEGVTAHETTSPPSSPIAMARQPCDKDVSQIVLASRPEYVRAGRHYQ